VWYGAGGIGVDTALDYGKECPGGKQTELAAAIAKAGVQRESVFITTKIRAALDVAHGGPLCVGLNAEYALKAVKEDLKELDVSSIDLVLLHAPCTSDATNAKLWQGLEQALAMNLTRAIGVSNYKKKALSALLAQPTTKTKPAVNQCQLSVGHKDDETIAYCKAQGVTYEAYDAMRGCPFSNTQVQAIAASHGVGVSQVCLRWVLQKGAIMAVGLGGNVTNMPEYAKENLALYGFTLTESEMALLDSVGAAAPAEASQVEA
jgi:diketogulonate reductase-like aldo/keto reductase